MICQVISMASIDFFRQNGNDDDEQLLFCRHDDARGRQRSRRNHWRRLRRRHSRLRQLSCLERKAAAPATRHPRLQKQLLDRVRAACLLASHFCSASPFLCVCLLVRARAQSTDQTKHALTSPILPLELQILLQRNRLRFVYVPV